MREAKRNTSAPTVQAGPVADMRSLSGTVANTAAQPIVSYRPVDHSLCFSRLNGLLATTIAAEPRRAAP